MSRATSKQVGYTTESQFQYQKDTGALETSSVMENEAGESEEVIEYYRYSREGLISQSEDARGNVSKAYHTDGRVATEWNADMSLGTSYSYDGLGRLTQKLEQGESNRAWKCQAYCL